MYCDAAGHLRKRERGEVRIDTANASPGTQRGLGTVEVPVADRARLHAGAGTVKRRSDLTVR